MNKTVVINIVGLSGRLIGAYTPFLSKWSANKKGALIQPVLPAVTCSVQSSYLTGKYPSEHGIVGNGWYFKDECEVKFWKQSNKLVNTDKIWDEAKKINPDFTCSNMFWWYNMYSNVDYSATPRPMYPADGRKLPDCYTSPMDLRDELQSELGQFPLFEFWGPRTTIRSTEWIAKASMYVDKKHDPSLTFIYLPHLDYCLQKWGVDFAKIKTDLLQIDSVCKDLITYYESRDTKVILLSEYGITDVSNPIHINRILRDNDLIAIKEEQGLELLDAGASDAFAVADHQISHVYFNKKDRLEQVKAILKNQKGIEHVLDREEQKKFNIDHDRAGDLVLVADKNSWFTYYYWLDDTKAPDFARTVDIHRKPGYDPVELFTDPTISMLPVKVAGKLLKKKMGFRTLMDIIPLDAKLVKGSHGRIPEDKSDWPVFVSDEPINHEMTPQDVYNVILQSVMGSSK
jgi:predicted AlkP superfamily pyrophosphatase or phosphodiesterase